MFCTDPSKTKLNKSYPQYLSGKNRFFIPNANPFLIGAGRKGLRGSVSSISRLEMPYNGSGIVFDGESGSSPVYVLESANGISSPQASQSSDLIRKNEDRTVSGTSAVMIAGMIGIAGSFLFA